MTLRVSTVFGFLAVILPFVSAGHWGRRHQEVAHRARGDVDIHKRQSYTNSRFTFYDVGLGACGQYNVASDWIVALNVGQYGSGYPGPQCFKSVTIQYGGKTGQATIMDECMGCPWGGLDFSRGLFDYFASESEGVIYGTWWFNDGSGGGGGGGGGDQTTSSTWIPPVTTWEQPATSSTPDYTPAPPTTSSTPAYTPSPTTSSTPAFTSSSTTSTTSTTSSTSSTSSINFSTGLASGLVVPTAGVVSPPDASNPQNILVINNILVEVGILLCAVAEKDG
ncbi:plant expansin [Boletus coccyginus]|nr:plant expansin [Boletus coccyginus]